MAPEWDEQQQALDVDGEADEAGEAEWMNDPGRPSADDPEFRGYRPNFAGGQQPRREPGPAFGPRYRSPDDPAFRGSRPAFDTRGQGFPHRRQPRRSLGAPFENEWPDYRPRLPDEDDEWRRPGRFTGYGPRGYQRADERIHEDICERLTYYGELDARDIEINVTDGEVTLTGTVEDRPSKRAAERIAETVSGVNDVHNELQLRTHAFTRDR